ncbi:MAG: TylF/MycF/NovP-related O-methyltransferase [Limisphaerales bacterium]
MPQTFSDKLRDGIRYRLRALRFYVRKVGGDFPIAKPVDPFGVQVLGDAGFQASVKEAAHLTVLDTGRLANLWKLCRMTDPGGNILEIGSFRGGGALHLSNSCPSRKIIACDSFRSFEEVHPTLDKSFHQGMFSNTGKERVAALFAARKRNYEVLDGFFPASAAGKTLAPVSFVHLDVDVYKATIESLNYLEQERILLDRSFIVLDDYDRKAEGVNQAVAEFVAAHKPWLAIPLFPAQCLMLTAAWFR